MSKDPRLCEPIPPPQNLATINSHTTHSTSPPPLPHRAFDVLSHDEVKNGTTGFPVKQPPQAQQPAARKLCVRHQRMADQNISATLQKSLDALPLKERETVNMIWSNFSSSSHPRRALILQGILTMCCFSQLSLLTEQLQHLIRLDPFHVLPREVSLQVLRNLDAISLGRAAQVSSLWRTLADDDILWKNICEQHIDKKCSKCGWGLPLLEKRRNARPRLPSPAQSASSASSLATKRDADQPGISDPRPLKRPRLASPTTKDGDLLEVPEMIAGCERFKDTLIRPWKDVYCERLTIERNWRRGRYSVRTLQGHTDGVMCMQFSETLEHPSFPILITGSYDRTARVWNMETGEQVTCMTGHTRALRALQFDQAKLITGSMDRTLRVWNWRNGSCIRTLEGHNEGVVCLNFDDNVLASGSVDTTVKVWNFRTGECFTLRGHKDWVNSVTLWDAPDPYRMSNGVHPTNEFNIDPGKMLFSASDDGSVRLWDLNRRTCVRQFLGHVGQVQTIRIVTLDPDTPDTELLAPSSIEPEEPGVNGTSHRLPYGDPRSRLGSGLPGWASASVSIPTTLPVDHPGFDDAAFTPPVGFDPYAYYNSPDVTPAPQAFLHPNLNGKGQGPSRSSSPGRKKGPTPILVSGSLDNTIKVWDIETGKTLKTLFGHIEGVWTIACDKLRLVSGSHDRTIKVWVREEGRCMATLVGHRGAVTCLALGDDKLVSGSDDGDIKIWNFSPP
ncbi:WD40 repeat-like protein [Hysterangium stoloniferum]|nr:WD40 repeat-like protein [Hysterangium stoloniferum]